MQSLTKEIALKFLAEHQPMPDMTQAGEEYEDIWNRWVDCIDYFITNPCIESVPLILNSYNGGDIPDDIVELDWESFEEDEVIPYIVSALQSSRESVREWTLYLVLYYETSNTYFIKAILERLVDDSANIRGMAALILNSLERDCYYDSNSDKEYIRNCYRNEHDKNVINCYCDEWDTLNAIVDLIPGRSVAHLPCTVVTLERYD